MKKIATITFHWATNYGAVLQSFALQKFWEKSGYEAEIIDYVLFASSCFPISTGYAIGNSASLKKRNASARSDLQS